MLIFASIVALLCIEGLIVYELIVSNRKIRIIDFVGLLVYGCMFLTFLRVFGIL